VFAGSLTRSLAKSTPSAMARPVLQAFWAARWSGSPIETFRGFGESSFFYEGDLKHLLHRLGGDQNLAAPLGAPELSILGEPVAAA